MTEPRHFNAHCHLELSHLRGAIPPGMPFVEWLSHIVTLKRNRPPEESRAAAADAIRELAASGTGGVLDIDAMGTGNAALRDARFPAISFTEIIDFDPALGAWAVDRTIERQSAYGELPETLRLGVSPHAPYTTTPRLLRAAASKAAEYQQWLCIHVSETPEETEMFVAGTGALHDYLRDVGVLPPGWKPPEMRPVAYLNAMGALGPRTLLAHLNDIDDSDLRILGEKRVSAVVCPGTHVYFDRGEFPLRRLLDAGIPTYLGTDSLASNESLDMAREIDLAAALSPGLPRETIEDRAAWERAADFGFET